MNKIQLVVFDIAGTTVRDNGNVADSFISAFNDYGLTMPREDVKKVMGFRKMDAIRILLDKFYPSTLEGSPQVVREVHERFIANMISFYDQDEDLSAFPYAEELFIRLKEKGIKIALNTGFTRAVADTLLRRLHWDNGHQMIDRVICSDEVAHGRPYPDMINALIGDLGISSPSFVLKVGDTSVDIDEGRNAGCGIVVGVTSGAHTRAQLEGSHPDHIIDDLRELEPIIMNS
ncbi:MAG: HAD-IA family hydrolase [Bacteroidota bacterium]|nr:HAD-IA family hydrolase [Bacteroidota bacterium]MDP4215218.1 HAD-IA family hydrolase [Bacteroidota bacterium]MDP4246184.1 HAD-IA family hydrolase [Bacteroidota bacterium]MDP4260001.1 HAD-IA family hydrolase [Bacteroidota bacterium]